MSEFNASIQLSVDSTAAERQVKKLDRNLQKIEDTTRDILGVDKEVIRQRKILVGLTGDQATAARKRIKLLGLQKSELALQKKELAQIVRLEKQRKTKVVAATGAVATSTDSGGGAAAAGLLAGLTFSKALNKEQAKSIDLSQKQFQATNKVVDVIEQKNAAQEKLNGLIKRVPNLEGQVKRITNQNNRIRKEGRKLTEGQVKQLQDAEFEVTKINSEIRKLTRETAKLGTEQEKYVDALEKGGKELVKQDNRLKRRQKIASGGKAALAGAAFSNVPGQDIFAAGAAGGLIGSAAGGIGAVPGAAIGASVAAILKLGSALAGLARPAAEAQAELSKLRIALAGVLGTEYAAGIEAINRASEDFNQTLNDTTKQFTQLSAAGVANGNTVQEVENLYRGLAAATKATGGSADDLNGVLRAATQVLSKNKVQAEELRGQIGDRLPGAFALFAEATGRTSQQLDKALKDGLVSADEFVTDFGNFIREKYEPAAFLISQSPAEAGARLEKTLKDLQRGIGPILQSIGAEFQTFANNALKSLEPLLAGLNKFLQLDRTGKNTRLANLEKNQIPELEELIRKAAGTSPGQRIPLPAILGKGGFSLDPSDNIGSLNTVDQIFTKASAKLVEFQARAQQLRSELFPTARPPAATVIEDPITEDEDKRTKDIKTLLGTDWAKAVGIEESKLLLKITELQGEALVNGNLKRVEQLELQKKSVRTQVEIEALTNAIAKAQARLVEFEGDDKLLAQGKAQILDLQNERLQRQLNLRNQLATAGNDAFRDDLEAAEAFGRIVQKADPLNRELTNTEELLNSIGGKITNGLVDGLALAVSGTDKLGESFRKLGADIAEAVGKALILNAITSGINALGGNDGVGLFSMLGGALGKREDGGPVLPNRPYIVGESGPELMVPDTSGTVIDAKTTERAMSRYSGSNNVGPQDGGGDVYGSGRSAGTMQPMPEIKFQSTVINNQEYVTRSQAEAIGLQAAQQGAKAGEARTLRRLQMSSGARSKIGL